MTYHFSARVESNDRSLGMAVCLTLGESAIPRSSTAAKLLRGKRDKKLASGRIVTSPSRSAL